jgi:Tol biopolymer transport system component/DNA-binding winged helix-turn-helix (wHTH) protein/tRNA A-37 threonylcarbamoyl transferase component Bud32
VNSPNLIQSKYLLVEKGGRGAYDTVPIRRWGRAVGVSSYEFEEFQLDLRRYELRRGGQALRLEKIPMELLILLLSRNGDLVSREEIVERLWGKDVFVETEHSINTAVRKIRQVLADDSDNPRFVKTLKGKGYRFDATVKIRQEQTGSVDVGPAEPVPSSPAPEQSESSNGHLIGQRVSHYRVLEVLGAGAMGIVYKAEDLKLGRRVALKFLTDDTVNDPKALERFKKEALAISGLDHPNICTIYDVGEHRGKPFLVMQLLEGQTLRERIESHVSGRTCFGNDELLDFALQLISGLESAHLKGMIHRDIKPANIFLTNRGEAKILDFGLAKSIQQREPLGSNSYLDLPGRSLQTSSPDGLTATVSYSGTTVGTPAYLSPEQIGGEPLDTRTDVYSLGLVMYEMATGHRAIAGSTEQELREAIREISPRPVRELNPKLSPELGQIIHRAIKKDRSARYGDATAMRQDLLQLRRGPSRLRYRNWVVGLVSLLVLLASGGFYSIVRHRSLNLPLEFTPLTTLPGFEGAPTFSPDGEQVAFDYLDGTGWNILTKRLDDDKILQLTESPGFSSCPSWSPNGKYIAYLKGTMASGLRVRSGIFLMTPLGGAKRKLLEVANVSCHVNWSPDSKTLVYGPSWSATQAAGLFLVDVENPIPRRLLTSPPNTMDDAPAFSHDGNRIAFARSTGLGTKDLYVVSSSGGEPTRLTDVNANLGGPAWTSDDTRIIFWAGSGWTVNIYSVSSNGGTPEKLPFGSYIGGSPTISRDGTKLAYVQSQFDPNIWRVEILSNNPPARFITSTLLDNAPDFSPDGSKIVFLSDRDGTQAIWVCNADGSNPRKIRLMGVPDTSIPQGPNIPKWSPAGNQIAYDGRHDRHRQIFVVDAEGGTPAQVTSGDFENQSPSWSRDGEWVYFGSDRNGRYEIYKTSLKTRETIQVTHNGGFYAEESPDGQLVFFNKPQDDKATWTYVKSGVYAIPKSGGPERLLVPDASWMWRAGKDGIYYTDNTAKPRPTLKLFRFNNGRIETLTTLDKESWGGPGGIAISPDGGTLLYGQIDSEGKDLVLVKNGSW